MNDKIKNIVTSAVIQAMAENGGDLIADKTAEILNGSEYGDSGVLGDMMALYRGFPGQKSRTYIESLIDAEMRVAAKEAVKDWFAERREALKRSVIEKIDAEKIAERYVENLEYVISKDGVEICMDIRIPDSSDDD